MPWTPNIEEDDPSERILATASAVPKDAVGEGGYTVQVNVNRQARRQKYQARRQQVHLEAKIAKEERRDMEKISKCLGWKPIDVCKQTLKATTQYAKSTLCLPLHDHFKARFPALNCKRLNEIFATDTFFVSSKGLGGYTCAQIYVGKVSILTKVFGMKSENEMKDTLQDFIRKWGALHSLLLDSAKSEVGNAVNTILHA